MSRRVRKEVYFELIRVRAPAVARIRERKKVLQPYFKKINDKGAEGGYLSFKSKTRDCTKFLITIQLGSVRMSVWPSNVHMYVRLYICQSLIFIDSY